MGGEGGVGYLTHNPGGSPYYARLYGPMTELAVKYPNIKTLDFQSPGWDMEKCKQVASDWITKFGDELKGMVASGDSEQALGMAEACKAAGRDDIVIIAAGNSKVGMDLVQEGAVYAITYQSAEADGALPIKLAADWFNGKELGPIYYIPKHVITQADVTEFMPAQW
jgi:ribose transport system substrate-binding protein